MEDPLPGSEYRMDNLAPEEVFPEFAAAYRSSYANAYVRISALDSWRLCETRPYIAGEFRWTGFDYLGESGYAGGWPARSGDKGVFDLCGFRKDIYYFYKSRWTSEPMVHVLPHWTWPGKEGKTIPVWCYSNCESVELFLNGKSLGRKSLDVSKSYYLSWDVPYEPGTMRAVARRGGVAVAEKTVQSAGEPERLSMSTDVDEIAGDGRDVAHLAVTVVDANGNLVPHAAHPVHFSIKGPGRIIGIGNGDILSHHDFQGTRVDAFHGMCLAIIQSERGRSGEIQITAESPGMQKSMVRIKVSSTVAQPTAPRH
jgi:beta-galactosidase